ncbi:NAD(+) diphosphatase [Salinibacterium sp. ZJ450]|uniref:NAD(+) diphosphatase n=1 Tax=Salinibacterium sp. ZJ450 TaxID=2708338 RepID=UPI00141D8164|nr:NAD(+) diphosphatase [Salinibacterium sp. ZJ450]
MTLSFSARLPLSHFEIDRDYLARTRDTLFEELWQDPATRVLALWNGTAPLDTPTSLRLLPATSVDRTGELVYLGRVTSATATEPVGTPVVATVITDEQAANLGTEWGNLRALATRLSDRDAALFTEALGILNWHAVHQFSPRSGERTVSTMGGWVRVDPVHNIELYPRTDPAIIVGVTDVADRLLLGSNALWENNRYSLLAGFVEPGESLESAVMREVLEESGVPVVNPTYLGSQPWPFPASLMLGFTAEVDAAWSGDLAPDGDEILDLRWFSRDELRDAIGDILLPGPSSIARGILEHWYGEPLDDGSRA